MVDFKGIGMRLVNTAKGAPSAFKPTMARIGRRGNVMSMALTSTDPTVVAGMKSALTHNMTRNVLRGAGIGAGVNMGRYGVRNAQEGRSWHDGLLGAGIRGGLTGAAGGAVFGPASMLSRKGNNAWRGFKKNHGTNFLNSSPNEHMSQFLGKTLKRDVTGMSYGDIIG